MLLLPIRLRTETHWIPIVVVIELSRQTVCRVGVGRRQFRAVRQTVELVLTVQEHSAIDVHDGRAIDARAHEPIQLSSN